MKSCDPIKSKHNTTSNIRTNIVMVETYFSSSNKVHMVLYYVTSIYIYIIFLAETTNYGLKKRVGNTLDATGFRNDIGRILIVSTGSIVSLVLVSIIVRKTYTFRRFSRTSSPWSYLLWWFVVFPPYGP